MSDFLYTIARSVCEALRDPTPSHTHWVLTFKPLGEAGTPGDYPAIQFGREGTPDILVYFLPESVCVQRRPG